jgi:hypothetical protein
VTIGLVILTGAGRWSHRDIPDGVIAYGNPCKGDKKQLRAKIAIITTTRPVNITTLKKRWSLMEASTVMKNALRFMLLT